MLSFRLFSVEQKSRTVSAVQVSRRFASRTAHSTRLVTTSWNSLHQLYWVLFPADNCVIVLIYISFNDIRKVHKTRVFTIVEKIYTDPCEDPFTAAAWVLPTLPSCQVC